MSGRDRNSPDTGYSAEIAERLREAEETLAAIRNGDVDAVVVSGPEGQQVYTLENADRPYRVLVEQMQEGAVTLSEDGTMLYCNERFAGLVGARRDTLIGHRITQFFADNEREMFVRLLAGGLRSGRSAEFMLGKQKGTQVPVNLSLADISVEDALPRVICMVVTDLTHSRRRSHELTAANALLASEIEERRRAEDSLELALDAAEMGSWDIDLATNVTRRSARFSQIFGLSTASPDLPMTTILDQFLPDDRTAVRSAFRGATAKGSVEFEKRMRRANDGAMRWVQVRGRTYYADATAVRIAGIISDVTDRRLIDEQLRQAQKMEAIGQLTGGIAHDFNNLLMVIGGSLEMLEDRLADDARARRYLDTARHGVDRGAKLNQQLLAFSRRQDLRVEAVCIDKLIPTFESLLDRAVGETVRIIIERAADHWYCRTDPHQLETAILNLAINARDAMPQGGELRLATSLREVCTHEASLLGATEGEYVRVEVTDTGIGMTAEVIAHVFEPFFTTKVVGKGTGLGLSQVYGFAKQSGGFVTIHSEPQQGTTIAIHLPRVATPDDTPERATLPARRKGGGDGVILVVEDDEDVRGVVAGMLRDLGYAVLEAESARRAIAVIDSGAPIDLVFTDVIMPGDMNGIELAHELRRQNSGLPVLLTSGYTAQRFAAEEQLKGLHLLRKPYTQAALSLAVEDAIRPGPGGLGTLSSA